MRRAIIVILRCHFAFMSDNAIVGEIVGKLWGKDIENTSGSPFLGSNSPYETCLSKY